MMYMHFVTQDCRDIAGYLMVEQDRFGDRNTDKVIWVEGRLRPCFSVKDRAWLVPSNTDRGNC